MNNNNNNSNNSNNSRIENNKTISTTTTNTINRDNTYFNNSERRESSSLEETVEKLTVSLRRLHSSSPLEHSRKFMRTTSRSPSMSEGRRERKRVVKSRSVDQTSSCSLPLPIRPLAENRRQSYYGHIRIESVL